MTTEQKRQFLKDLRDGIGPRLIISLLNNDEKLRLAMILRRIRESSGQTIEDIRNLEIHGATPEETTFVNELIKKYSK